MANPLIREIFEMTPLSTTRGTLTSCSRSVFMLPVPFVLTFTVNAWLIFGTTYWGVSILVPTSIFITVKLADLSDYMRCFLQMSFILPFAVNVRSLMLSMYFRGKLGTCESEISVRIESRIELAAAIRIRIEYRIESGGSRLHVQCRLSCGSCVFNNV